MIRVNLLAPEKPAAQKRAKAPTEPGAFQLYLFLVLFVGGTLAICGAAWWYESNAIAELDRQIAAAQKRQQELQAIKVQVDALEAKRNTYQRKIELIERLRQEQSGPVHMLDEISKSLPDFVWLTQMDSKGATVSFKGQSNSLTAVADFIEALQRSGWFPNVGAPTMKEQAGVVTFDMNATFTDPTIAAKAKAAAQAAAQASRQAGAAPKP